MGLSVKYHLLWKETALMGVARGINLGQIISDQFNPGLLNNNSGRFSRTWPMTPLSQLLGLDKDTRHRFYPVEQALNPIRK